MNSAADSLLALSTTAVALADAEQPQDDDDRSSSLSELDGELDEDDLDEAAEDADEDELDDAEEDENLEETPDRRGPADGDSEAETERLEESPEKLNRRKSFVATPSKLAQPIQMNHSPNERPEIESLTESAISSPISTNDDSDDDLSDAPAENEEEDIQKKNQFGNTSPGKRKREEDEQDTDAQSNNRKRRTLSNVSDVAKSDRDSGPGDPPSRESKEGSTEPTAGAAEADEAQTDDEGTGNKKAAVKKPTPPSRVSSRRKGKDEQQQDTEVEAEEDADGVEESDEAEVDDTEVAAKSEEEQAKRMAAMEGLGVLERHFATLRDRLYDERIAAINHELAQLAEPTPSHPELLKQVEAVKKYRDEKFDIEQKLLVYKIGALKTKSVAERAQINSAYFQEVRDIRERHLEKISAHFYQIQRERFKSEPSTVYSVPFATKRSKQITQQTAFNKEVSLLSGIAKYVGFPAAPDLAQTSQSELDDDLRKMGVSFASTDSSLILTDHQMTNQNRLSRAVQRVTGAFGNISAPAEEQSFLDKNPWANAQHPMHRLGASRQNSNRSPAPTYLTPANQHRQGEKPGVLGSASTIAEYPSSSQINTPHDNSTSKPDVPTVSGYGINGRQESISPLDTRRNGANQLEGSKRATDTAHDGGSSPLTARIAQVPSPQRQFMSLADNMAGRTTASPSMPTKVAGITTGPGFGLGRFS